MAELSRYPAQERRLFECFPRSYNAIHGTRFKGVPERAGKVDRGWDYRWPDPDRPRTFLEVQHTAGASNADLERVHMRHSALINKSIADDLKARGHQGYYVALSGADTPRQPRALQRAVEYLCMEIDRSIKAGIRPGGSARGKIPWRTERQNGVFEVEIRNVGTKGPPLVTFMPTPNGYFENTPWRLAEAVRLKSEHIGGAKTDTVLVVDFDLNGFDFEDIEALTTELQDDSIPYREVWAADLGPETKLRRVWPRT